MQRRLVTKTNTLCLFAIYKEVLSDLFDLNSKQNVNYYYIPLILSL
ncbi:hypothetical protein Lalb_Chr24g0392831 [Lupinus albus]|uniref:Uncharacterized protein n=1 Tax=Lupinus albus TaxID=3870 RepID=A0A6A4N9X3_LUPAL|nr:hypothetical protein Lalb_Chr24g0392831 [Lupinus albus]